MISTLPPVLGSDHTQRYKKSERFFSHVIAIAILAPILVCNSAVAVDQTSPSVVEATDQVQISETTTNGFVHPGIGLTKEILENARMEVLANKEPWLSGFRALASNPDSATNISCRNQSRKDPSKPESDAFDKRGINDRLIGDSFKAYHQVLMYYFTGDEVYRANAINIVRVWSQMDRTKYKPWPEDNIHSSYPIQRMIMTAEILRYTSFRAPKLAWTEQDTDNFNENFVHPAVDTFLDGNIGFMNQNGYPNAAAISADIFASDRQNYERHVERFTVNKDAPNKGWCFSIKDLARLVTVNTLTGQRVDHPQVQLIEMGRDQAHAGDDMEIFTNIVRMMHAQGTKVDPVTGVISTADNAVDPYEFLDDRILAAADYFSRFMLGYDTPWIPAADDIDPNGMVRAIYPRIADNYRGRIREHEFWDPFYYYTYKKGIDVAKKAPYYYEAFTKRIVSSNVEWLFIPKEATGEAARVAPSVQEPDLVNVVERSTALSTDGVAVRDGSETFLRVIPTETGTPIAFLSSATPSKTIGLRIRTTGTTTLEMSGFAKAWWLPDTQGKWRFVSYTMDKIEHWGDIAFVRVKGSHDAVVEISQLLRKPDPQMVAPSFASGNEPLRLVAYRGAPVTIDLSAAKPGSAESISYECSDKPNDSTLDPNTGAFSWKPQAEGEHSFIVTALAGETVGAKKVTIVVAPDRSDALKVATVGYDPNAKYVGASLERYTTAYDQAAGDIATASDSDFFAQLASLQQAVQLLEPLTPLLKDGSLDFPKVVASSNIGESIGLLVDGNADTFPVYLLAKGLNYIFDFGPEFKFSATAFAMEGRLNFEDRVTNTKFLGSNDGKYWTELTPKAIGPATELSRVEVAPDLTHSTFRFLRIQKQGGTLFEPSELRIYGERHE